MIYFTENDIDRLIEDDVPTGDLTTTLFELEGKKASIELFARHEMIICCTEEAKRMYIKAGLSVKYCVPSGRKLKESEKIIEASGDAAAIHMIWRTGLAMIEFASGIATRTGRLVDSVKSVNPYATVAGTRKHPPFLKKIALKALIAGGGIPHRTGLSDSILIFREHLAFTGGYGNIKNVIDDIKMKQKERKVVVEAHSTEETAICTRAGADAIQIDKMNPEQFAACVRGCRSINPDIIMIAAGGIKESNIEIYTEAGADVLVSSFMYFAPPADIKAKITPL